jgi:hypothetical protein
MYNSDGVLTFSIGAFAPGVTVQKATNRLLAIDGGIKWHSLAANGQYYFRRVNDFLADGPMPISSTFDHGGELSVSYFVAPKTLMLYGHTSGIVGQFGNPSEYSGGFQVVFRPDQPVWLQGGAPRVYKPLMPGQLPCIPEAWTFGRRRFRQSSVSDICGLLEERIATRLGPGHLVDFIAIVALNAEPGTRKKSRCTETTETGSRLSNASPIEGV